MPSLKHDFLFFLGLFFLRIVIWIGLNGIFEAMRTVCYLLIILLTGLITFPCMDRFQSTASGLSFQQSHSAIQGSDFPSNDDCSPFCSCSCCNLPAFKMAVNYSLSIPLSGINSYADYQSKQIIPGLIKVWQPPKINS